LSAILRAESVVGALRQRGEERHECDGLDHDEEEHEKFQQLVGHSPLPPCGSERAVDHTFRAS
jgi:hypothetical protein